VPAVDPGRFFFRLIEHDDGSWTCRRGRQDLDRHPGQDEALAHLTEVAATHRPSRVYVHHLDGRVFAAASFD
jgi:hypothetical protein